MLEAGGGSILVGLGNYAVSYGAGLAAAFIAGKVQKLSPYVENDTIPLNNGILTGSGAGACTGDHIQALATIAGSFTAGLIHQGWKKLSSRW